MDVTAENDNGEEQAIRVKDWREAVHIGTQAPGVSISAADGWFFTFATAAVNPKLAAPKVQKP